MTTNVQCPECKASVDIDSVLAEFGHTHGFATRRKLVRCRGCTNLLVLVQAKVVMFVIALIIAAGVLTAFLTYVGVNEIVAVIGVFGPAVYAGFHAHDWFSELRVADADDVAKSPYLPPRD